MDSYPRKYVAFSRPPIRPPMRIASSRRLVIHYGASHTHPTT